MSDSEDSIQEQLAALRQTFIDQLPQRINCLYDAHIAWSQGGDGLREYHRLAHSLTGAGATFGCGQVSQAARQLEHFLKEAMESGQFSVQLIEGAATLLGVLRQEVAAESSSGSAPETGQSGVAVEFEPGGSEAAEDARLVYLLGNEATLASGIAGQLEYFGYRVHSYAVVDELKQAVAELPPGAILADVSLPEGEEAGIQALADIQRLQETPVPTVFFSDHCDDINSRLAAVHAKGMSYLPAPVAVDVLVDVLDGLVETETPEALRVLIVDAQREQADHNASLLQDAGMAVALLPDPMRLFDALAGVSPELVLMGASVPFCGGVELAAVIRQQPEYADLPIVFLSSEDERRTVPHITQVHADDFLASPVNSARLIGAVESRAGRYRLLRSMKRRDALTGLLNHSHIMEMLAREAARVERYGVPLSFALLDIDLFKAVNDTYGHSVGDSVIKSLSRLIQQRLRKSDVIGRYDGEKFAIVMPETPLSAASRVMNDVRRLFEGVTHHAGGKSFLLTLSGGVAALPPASAVSGVCDMAEKMVRRAKDAGRNQVVSSDAE